MIIRIINFYAVGSLISLLITFMDCLKYKNYFDEFEYEDKHYIVMFLISSVLSWYMTVKYLSELILTHGEDSEEDKIAFLKELKLYIEVILSNIFKQ